MTFAEQLRSDHSTTDAVASDAAMQKLGRLRVDASLSLTVKHHDGRTRLSDLAEGSGYRMKFPDADPDLEAVIVNTGGGLLGGDAFKLSVHADENARLSITTQSAEKVYQAIDESSKVEVKLQLGRGACLHWIPQECILFSGAALERKLNVDMAEGSELLMAESMIFGRLAMGEAVNAGSFMDRWRIRQAGRLVYADDYRLSGNMAAKLNRAAIGGEARAMGTILLVSSQAESRLDHIRSSLHHTDVDMGASAWNGKLVVRMMAKNPQHLRTAMIQALEFLREQPVPRNW